MPKFHETTPPTSTNRIPSTPKDSKHFKTSFKQPNIIYPNSTHSKDQIELDQKFTKNIVAMYEVLQVETLGD